MRRLRNTGSRMLVIGHGGGDKGPAGYGAFARDRATAVVSSSRGAKAASKLNPSQPAME